MRFSPDARRLIAVVRDSEGGHEIKAFDAETGQELFSFPMPAAVSRLALSRDGHRLAALDGQGTVWVWDATPLPEAKPEPRP